MKKSIYSMFCCYKSNFNTTYCVLLSYYDTHLVISIQSTKQIRNRYSCIYHPKPSFFLLYKPFNQSINLTKITSNPYPSRFIAFNLSPIVSSSSPFNTFPYFRLPKSPSNQRFPISKTPILTILSLYTNKMVLCYLDKTHILYIFMIFQ